MHGLSVLGEQLVFGMTQLEQRSGQTIHVFNTLNLAAVPVKDSDRFNHRERPLSVLEHDKDVTRIGRGSGSVSQVEIQVGVARVQVPVTEIELDDGQVLTAFGIISRMLGRTLLCGTLDGR